MRKKPREFSREFVEAFSKWLAITFYVFTRISSALSLSTSLYATIHFILFDFYETDFAVITCSDGSKDVLNISRLL